MKRHPQPCRRSEMRRLRLFLVSVLCLVIWGGLIDVTLSPARTGRDVAANLLGGPRTLEAIVTGVDGGARGALRQGEEAPRDGMRDFLRSLQRSPEEVPRDRGSRRFDGTLTGSVTLQSPAGNSFAVAAYSLTDGTTYYAVPDNAAGTYTIDVPTGQTYLLVAWATNHARAFYPNELTYHTARPIELTAADPRVDNLNFSLRLGGRLGGSVRDGTTTAPLANVRVVILTSDGLWYDETQTDGSGAYLEDFVGLGGYFVRTDVDPFTDGNYANQWYDAVRGLLDATLIELSASAPDRLDINFGLRPGAQLTGTISTDVGDPLDGATVVAVPLNVLSTWDVVSTATAADGTFDLRGLHQGAYVLLAQADGYVRKYWMDTVYLRHARPFWLSEGEVLTDMDFSLFPGNQIQGRVVDGGGQPLANAQVVARSTAFPAGREAQTDANGDYAITGLFPAGGYHVRATERDHGAASYPTPVDVSAGDAAGIDFSLGLASSISGIVMVDAGSGSQVPLSGAWVTAYSAEAGVSLSTLTNGEGEYHIFGLPPVGDLLVSAGHPTAARRWYVDAADSAAATPIDLTQHPALDIDLLLPLGRKITGTILDPLSAPIEGALVLAYAEDRDSGAYAVTGPDGTYQLLGLDTTRYVVMARAEGYADTWYDGTSSPSQATLVDVTAADGVADIAMPLASVISGAVTESGIGRGDVVVFAYSPTLDGGGVTRSFSDGTYLLDRLAPASDYLVGVWSPTYARIFYDGAASVADATLLDVTGGPLSGIDFQVSVGGRIAGTVTDGSQPVAGAEVVVSTGGLASSFVAHARTTTDGTYETPAVAPGTYDLEVRAPGYETGSRSGVVVTAETTTTGQDVVLSPGGEIRGVLLGNGAPITGEDAVAYAYRVDDTAWIQSAGADETGAFAIRGLPSGTYKIYAKAPSFTGEYYDDRQTLLGADTITVTAGAVTTLPSPIDLAPSTGGGGSRCCGSGIWIDVMGSSSGQGGGTWSANRVVEVSWTTSGSGGLLGYSILWDHAPLTTGPTEMTLGKQTTSASSEPLADGTWYVHLRPYYLDNFEPTWGDTFHGGPFLIDGSPPPAPTDMTLTPGDGNVVVMWSNPSGDNGPAGLAEIRVLRKTGSYPTDPNDGQIVFAAGPPPPGAQAITDTGLTNGATYYYTLFALDAAGNPSDTSARGPAVPAGTGGDTTPPQTVSGFITVAGDGYLDLIWQNPGDGDLQGVVIRYRTDTYPASPSDGFQAANLEAQPGTWATFRHQNLTNGITYYYTIFPYDKSGNQAGKGPGSVASGAPRVPVPWGHGPTMAMALLLLSLLLVRRRRRHETVDLLP